MVRNFISDWHEWLTVQSEVNWSGLTYNLTYFQKWVKELRDDNEDYRIIKNKDWTEFINYLEPNTNLAQWLLNIYDDYYTTDKNKEQLDLKGITWEEQWMIRWFVLDHFQEQNKFVIPEYYAPLTPRLTDYSDPRLNKDYSSLPKNLAKEVKKYWTYLRKELIERLEKVRQIKRDLIDKQSTIDDTKSQLGEEIISLKEELAKKNSDQQILDSFSSLELMQALDRKKNNF